jgi:hypothetical protein
MFFAVLSSGFRVQGSGLKSFGVCPQDALGKLISGFGCQVPAQPLAAEAVSLIEKETKK